MQWGVRAYNSWRNAKINNGQALDMKIFEANLDNLGSLRKEDLCYSLTRFIPEVTKIKDGSDYPGKTLYEMIVSIQKYLNQNEKPWKIIEDPEFINVKTVLDNVMKEYSKLNLGSTKKQVEVITLEHEEYLWQSNILGEETPDQLRDTVLFLLGINLALRAGDEHYDLHRSTHEKPSQLSFE